MTENYKQIYNQIKKNWDAIAKPLDSMGKLEHLIAQIGAIQGTDKPRLEKTAALILCADNGIVEEGISQSDQSVTRICTENIARKETTVGIMASQANCDVFAVDLGVNTDDILTSEVLNKKIRKSTRNFLIEPAMTEPETHIAIETGKDLVRELKEEGYEAICIGEMGIGNTTTSAAIATALLKEKASDMTGRGAGLDDAKLAHKKEVIQTAIDQYDLYHADVMTVLQTVGGYDIAGMVGVYLAARKYKMPVVLDGAISMVAALVAEAMEPGTIHYLIPSHKSREPLAMKICEKLNLNPVLDAGMALGEGTGAVLFLGTLQTALKVYDFSVPFASSGVDQYVRYDEGAEV